MKWAALLLVLVACGSVEPEAEFVSEYRAYLEEVDPDLAAEESDTGIAQMGQVACTTMDALDMDYQEGRDWWTDRRDLDYPWGTEETFTLAVEAFCPELSP